MDAQLLNTIANFIWGIADDCLRDVYVRGKYRDVILPMTVIRRLDAVLKQKGIRAWVDYWGYDVSHDWPWWKKQIRYFLPFVVGQP